MKKKSDKTHKNNTGVRDNVNRRERTEEKLHLEERRFRAFVEHSSDIIVLLNLEGIITYINPAIEKVLGFKPEERIGARGLEFVHPDDRKSLIDKFKTLAVDINAPAVRFEMRLRHKDGSWRTIEAVESNLVNNNVVEAIIVNYRDITERKQAVDALLESEERYRLITENTADTIAVFDLNLNITTYVSPLIRKLRGYTVQEAMTQTLNQMLTPDSFQQLSKLFADQMALESSGTADPARTVLIELEENCKDGSTIWVEVAASFLRDNNFKPNGILTLTRNITDRKQAEERLKETLDRLRKAFGTTIQVMVSAVEMRDPYTSGHQKKSADIARAIAMEMGFPQDKVDGIRMAGIIHDIGKLSIPAEILSKSTKLTNIEFSLIKEHSRTGYEMLKDVESPWPLAEIVYQHHERMNGSGYPRNLKGDEILMESRILAVADVVEAMASHRPYRPTLGIEATLEEIEKNRGILYDTAVADACLKLFREKGYQLK
jgi:PAS domain S-box-containing protein/putative nucleotidyltransferase with HDIG domain